VAGFVTDDEIRVASIVDGVVSVKSIACTPPVTCARAVATESGFLLAVPANDLIGECGVEHVLPNRIRLFHWSNGGEPELTDELVVDGWIVWLELVARDDGAWLVWRETTDLGPV